MKSSGRFIIKRRTDPAEYKHDRELKNLRVSPGNNLSEIYIIQIYANMIQVQSMCKRRRGVYPNRH